MRTMLISLILICSLAQLAIAGAAPVLVDSGGCGTTYTCLAPEKCRASSTKTFQESIVKEIDDSQISADCEAIIRFHRYDKRKTHISIESFKDTSKVNKIEFIQEGTNDKSGQIEQFNKFKCEIDATDRKMKGKSFDDVKTQTDIMEKLKCTFEVLKDPAHGDKYISDDKLQFKIFAENDQQGVATQKEDYDNDIKVRCDPKDLEFEPPINDIAKLYKKVSTRFLPENYKCDDEEFKMEFRKKFSDKYAFAKEVKCKGRNFVVTGEEIDSSTGKNAEFEFGSNDILEIRCVAEAKFFCKYSPKTRSVDESLLYEEKSDGNSLKCPADKPYFVIVGQIDRYLHNPEFKCIAVGENTLWSIKREKSVEIFPKDGKTVFCTDQLKCKKPISARAVEDGTLGRDAFPKCFKYGTLKTADTKEVATNFTCDTKIGEYKYTAGGQAKIIDDTTKFICEYPADPTPPTIDEATKDKITTGVFVAFGLGAAFIIGSCAFSCFLMKQKMKRKKKAYLAEQARNVQYMTKEEKAAIKKKEKELRAKNPQKSGEKSKPAEKDETMEEQKAPVKTSQHQCMTKLGVTINAKDQKVDDNQGMKNDGAKKYEKRHMPKGIRGHRSTRIFKTLNSNNDVIVALVKEMDVKRKKGKIPGDNEC